MYNSDDFINYLGVDYEKKGNLRRIICPFHNDTKPSLVIYPEIDRGCCCFACGETCSWAYLATVVKGIDYKQALKDLGQDTLQPSEIKHEIKPQPLNFCDPIKTEFAKAFTYKHNQCLTIEQAIEKMDDKAIEDFLMWLSEKELGDIAMELDWRWHDGTVFKRWGKGILIPYKIMDTVVYERFREWDPETHKFAKPKGPFDVPIQPYLSTFRPNSTVFVAEGESDCASLYAHGASALGTPGAVAKKAINSIVAFIADRPYIEQIVCCGDNDDAGQKMNQLIGEAVFEMCPKKRLLSYSVESKGEKADINDDHVAGLLKIPVEWTANYGDNYNRQPWADKDFAQYVDKLDSVFTEREAKGLDPFTGKPKEEEKPADVSQEDKPLVVEVWEPRYRDRKILILSSKVIKGTKKIHVNFTKGTYAGQTWEVPEEVVAKGTLETIVHKPNGNVSEMFVVPLDECVRIK